MIQDTLRLAGLAIAIGATVALCACSVAPTTVGENDTRNANTYTDFGKAVREARARQTINPTAGRSADPVAGVDGESAQHAIDRYQNSFKEPPRTFNVLGIGTSGFGVGTGN